MAVLRARPTVTVEGALSDAVARVLLLGCLPSFKCVVPEPDEIFVWLQASCDLASGLRTTVLGAGCI